MVHSESLEHITIQNQRSQFILERALFFAPQEFSLILVRCNYIDFATTIRQQIFQTHHLHQLWQQQQPEFAFEYYGDKDLAQWVAGEKHQGLICLYLTTQSTNLEEILSLVFASLQGMGVQRDCINGVMVFGLEQVGRLQLSLALLNQVRDQLSYLLPCPLVLWLTDWGAQKLFRMAPDVKSWAVTSIRFTWDTESLQRLWRELEQDCFGQLERAGGMQFLSNKTLDLATFGQRRLELELSHRELLERQVMVPPFVMGFWGFINGREAYGEHNLEGARAAYLESLRIYGQLHDGRDITADILRDPQGKEWEALDPPLQRRLALLFFHVSLLYDEFAQGQSDSTQDWQEGQAYLRASLCFWERLEEWQWVAHLTTALGLMLRQLQRWDDLELLAWQTIKKLDVCCSQMLLTRNYGLLAEVAIARRQWEKAEMLAQSAIDSYDITQETTSQYDLPWYYLVLAQAKEHLTGRGEAIAHLEKAHSLVLANLDQAQYQRQTWLGWYLRLYRDILHNLHRLYWQGGDYRHAFDRRQELQFYERQWGWRVFLGAAALPAPSPTASPDLRQNTQNILQASRRHEDIKRLLERLSRDEHKLIILHGASGVGKTSLLQAGLLPSLWGQLMNAREVLPIMLTKYGQWRQSLTGAIAHQRQQLLGTIEVSPGEDPLALLQENGRFNLLTVLIFDQFEQFLEVYTSPSERRGFFQFLSQCLQLPFVKIILSLREDHLFYLLEWEKYGDLGIVNDNLLDRSVRYHLGNLDAAAAHNLLSFLGSQSPKSLEETFIDRLIADLSNDVGEVRPIELQVIGFQLQRDNITSLEKYLELGAAPRQQVLERFLSQIVYQCGEDQYQLAWGFLYKLTSPRFARPEVAASEFVTLCRTDAPSRGDGQAIADLILHIFVGSGLVIRHRYGFQDTYQLVHDYLVRPIRHHYEQVQSQQLADNLASKEREISRIRRHWGQSVITIFGLVGVVISMVFLARRAEFQREQQWQVTQNAELMALSNASEALFYNDQQFEALLESLRATVRLKNIWQDKPTAIAPATQLKVLSTLEQAYFGLQEQNRLEGHIDSVFDINLSPDGKNLISAGRDGTVRLWEQDGQLLTTMIGHTDRVTRAIFAPDGRTIFSGSWDGTVREWSRQGKELRKLDSPIQQITAINLDPAGKILAIAGSEGAELLALNGTEENSLIADRVVNWITFSPDGEEILTLEENQQITIWDREGNPKQTLRPQDNPDADLLFATFSPDGKTVVSADVLGNLNFWQRGDRTSLFPSESLTLLNAHAAPVFFVSFSEDGSRFVTAGGDHLIKLWTKDFTLQNTFEGHRDNITGVLFHPEKNQLISASMDKTIRFWDLSVDQRVVLDHPQPIRDVRFSPDGQYLVTASEDKTLRIWGRQGNLLQVLTGHQGVVETVSWSPDGKTLLSGGDDRTVRLWSTDGTLLKTLTGHGDRLLDVAWSPDGKVFASAGLDKTVRIWSAEGKLLQVLEEHTARVNSVAFSPDNRLLASVSDDQTVKVWQRRENLSFFLAAQLEGRNGWLTDVTFSRDGKYLAFSGYDNTIQIFQIGYQNGNPEFTDPVILKGHSDSIAHLQFNPTVPILATSSWNNHLQFWQLDDTLLKSLSGHQQILTGLDWSPDGKAIATASEDNTAIIWELDLDRLLQKSCVWLADYLRYNPSVRDGDRRLCDAPE